MALEKMVPVAGDVTLLRLGLSDDDWHRMQKVSVIFHAAASVRYFIILFYGIFLDVSFVGK